MVKVISGNSDSQAFFVNVANEQRRPSINRHMIHPEEGLDPVPVLNPITVRQMDQKKMSITDSNLYYPSRLERLVIASEEKPISELERLKKMGF